MARSGLIIPTSHEKTVASKCGASGERGHASISPAHAFDTSATFTPAPRRRSTAATVAVSAESSASSKRAARRRAAHSIRSIGTVGSMSCATTRSTSTASLIRPVARPSRSSNQRRSYASRGRPRSSHVGGTAAFGRTETSVWKRSKRTARGRGMAGGTGDASCPHGAGRPRFGRCDRSLAGDVDDELSAMHSPAVLEEPQRLPASERQAAVGDRDRLARPRQRRLQVRGHVVVAFVVVLVRSALGGEALEPRREIAAYGGVVVVL